MKHGSELTTIVQQTYNNRSTMKNQWNTRMKHDNETQQRKTTYKHSNVTQQWKTTTVQQWNQQWKTRMKKQQSYNNQKAIKHTNETRQ